MEALPYYYYSKVLNKQSKTWKKNAKSNRNSESSTIRNKGVGGVFEKINYGAGNRHVFNTSYFVNIVNTSQFHEITHFDIC